MTDNRHNSVIIRQALVQYKRGKSAKSLDVVRSPSTASAFLRSILPDNSREHLLGLYLDASHRPIAYSVISTGTANSAFVHPREVFQPAIMLGACALIVAHNHPSGDTIPSNEDIEVTKRLETAGELLGVKMLDHLILTDTECRSVRG